MIVHVSGTSTATSSVLTTQPKSKLCALKDLVPAVWSIVMLPEGKYENVPFWVNPVVKPVPMILFVYVIGLY